jgi:hypothetical protein
MLSFGNLHAIVRRRLDRQQGTYRAFLHDTGASATVTSQIA